MERSEAPNDAATNTLKGYSPEQGAVFFLSRPGSQAKHPAESALSPDFLGFFGGVTSFFPGDFLAWTGAPDRMNVQTGS
jgi:hypothetical protein